MTVLEQCLKLISLYFSPNIPVTKRIPFNFDHLIYYFSISIFNPFLCLFLLFTNTYIASNNNNNVTIYCIIVLIFWLIRAINIHLRLADFEKYQFNGIRNGKGLNILVTGGCNGLGYSLVRALLHSGLKINKIVIVDISDLPNILKDESVIKYFKCDVSDTTAFKELFQIMVDKLKDEEDDCFRIDFVFNNAGARQDKGLLDLIDSEIDNIFRINFFAPLGLTKLVIGNHIKNQTKREVKSNDMPVDRLHITTISSVLAFMGPKNLSIYASSKAALGTMIESLSHEVNVSHPEIIFNTIYPGQLTSKMFSDVKPSKEFLSPMIDVVLLADRIVDMTFRLGIRGVFFCPFYARVLPAIRSLPNSISEGLRKFSRMDQQIKPISLEENKSQ
ncbi:hypothetical protein BVG19_g941 [[Candida] boidinii]|nr:hypothetical protein BVG19_g941 [[Candida] boidinii]OWB50594.1 hypothetical protein B5S27_g2145 [[Candida] boidinii]